MSRARGASNLYGKTKQKKKGKTVFISKKSLSERAFQYPSFPVLRNRPKTNGKSRENAQRKRRLVPTGLYTIKP